MKIFIDSADIEEIEQAYVWGICDGVTTNPSLLKKAVDKRIQKKQKLDLSLYLQQILRTAKGTPVSLEVTELTVAGMIKQGKRLYQLFNPIARNVYIKIPINPCRMESEGKHFEGLEAIRALRKEGIPVNCTLIFTPEQALLAAKAGASIVSPFAGRVDDYLRTMHHHKFQKDDYYPAQGWFEKGKVWNDNGIVSGIDLVRQCVLMLQRYSLPAQVLAASLRNSRQVREAALIGAHIATVPFSVLQELLKHPKTFEGMAHFTADTVPEYTRL